VCIYYIYIYLCIHKYVFIALFCITFKYRSYVTLKGVLKHQLLLFVLRFVVSSKRLHTSIQLTCTKECNIT
jgi:hypothetical protein